MPRFLSGCPEFLAKEKEGLQAPVRTFWLKAAEIKISPSPLRGVSLCCFETNEQGELTPEYFPRVFLVAKLPTLLRCWLGT